MKYLNSILFLLVFGAGFILGLIKNDLPGVHLDKEIRLFEPLTFLLTATIGVLIPFYIKRWIDDSRHIKNNLIDELKSTLKEYELIKNKIHCCYATKQITSSDKEEINILFEQADMKLNCLKDQMITAFDRETNNLRIEIEAKCIDYWKFTTGAEMMSTKFNVITESFYRQHNLYFLNFETAIKKSILKIHKL